MARMKLRNFMHAMDPGHEPTCKDLVQAFNAWIRATHAAKGCVLFSSQTFSWLLRAAPAWRSGRRSCVTCSTLPTRATRRMRGGWPEPAASWWPRCALRTVWMCDVHTCEDLPSVHTVGFWPLCIHGTTVFTHRSTPMCVQAWQPSSKAGMTEEEEEE